MTDATTGAFSDKQQARLRAIAAETEKLQIALNATFVAFLVSNDVDVDAFDARLLPDCSGYVLTAKKAPA